MLTGLPHAARRARLDLFHAPFYTTPIGGPRPVVLTIHDVSHERHPEWYPYKRDPLRRAFYRRSARTAGIASSRIRSSEIRDLLPVRRASGHDRRRSARVGGDVLRRTAAAAPIRVAGVTIRAARRRPAHQTQSGDGCSRRGSAPAMRSEGTGVDAVLVGQDRGAATCCVRSLAVRRTAPRRGDLSAHWATEVDLLALYRSAVALVYPSRHEGFGLPMLEAMSCGAPVIAARSSSIPRSSATPRASGPG